VVELVGRALGSEGLEVVVLDGATAVRRNDAIIGQYPDGVLGVGEEPLFREATQSGQPFEDGVLPPAPPKMHDDVVVQIRGIYLEEIWGKLEWFDPRSIKVMTLGVDLETHEIRIGVKARSPDSAEGLAETLAGLVRRVPVDDELHEITGSMVIQSQKAAWTGGVKAPRPTGSVPAGHFVVDLTVPTHLWKDALESFAAKAAERQEQKEGQ
jgi:hypothetical protein